ncbi:MAG TPA: hypothetical protein VG982_01945 [Candidatus Paceibacterota bacterium]|nr:hypothetical protein [Candidatus Paceibacterota bacterium]
MKYENPTNEQLEPFEDDRELPPQEQQIKQQKIEEIFENAAQSRPDKKPSTLDQEKIKQIKKSISVEHAIDTAQEKKSMGDESWVDERPKEERKKPWYLRVAAMFGIAGAMAIPHKADAKTLEDSLSHKDAKVVAMKNDPTDSLQAKIAGGVKTITAIQEGKKVGNVTIESRYLIPYHDKTVEVCVVKVSGNENDNNKAGAIINAMQKEGGWQPASEDILTAVATENPNFSKKMPWVMSLVPKSDQNDTRANEGYTYVSEENGEEKIENVIPEHAVFPTRTPIGPNRFEADQGISYSEDDYGYIFYRKVTAAQYESGFAKTK